MPCEFYQTPAAEDRQAGETDPRADYNPLNPPKIKPEIKTPTR